MRRSLPTILLATALAASGGCGSSAELPHTKSGSLMMIEGFGE